ncbi:MAG: transporter substrate-binding domain-containing protein [Pseudomonadota bacterium]
MSALCLFVAGTVLAKDTVNVCSERVDVPPWRTGTGTGLNFDLLNQVASQIGITFVYSSVPWKRCLAQLKSNEMDGAFAASFVPERMDLGVYPGGAQLDVGKRMHTDHFVLIRRKGTRADWDGKAFSNISGAIGYQLGYSVGEFLRAKGMTVDEGTQSAPQLIQKLRAGRLAAAALGGSDATRLLSGAAGAELEVLPIPIIEKHYYLVLSHALVRNNPQLANRIWNAIEEARNSAVYQKRLHEAEDAGHYNEKSAP